MKESPFIVIVINKMKKELIKKTTLKDIGLQPILKTLKDLHTEAGRFEDSDVDDFKVVIREEAIKHIVDCLKKQKNPFEAWKHSMNITSEDLANAY